MQHAEKLYLVPKHQLDRLRTASLHENIHTVVENDLDSSIRDILQRHDLNTYEKSKLYTSVLQRFLNVVKHGDMESSTLTLTSPEHETPVTPHTPDVRNDDVSEDPIVSEVLNNIPQRRLKNVKYIMDKMSKAKHVSSWTVDGEFVYKGRITPGSHIFDLVKSVTSPQTIHENRRPVGWYEFLNAFVALKIPHSTVTNHNVRRMIESFKRKTHADDFGTVPTKSLKKRHTHTHAHDSDENVFNPASVDEKEWMDF